MTQKRERNWSWSFTSSSDVMCVLLGFKYFGSCLELFMSLLYLVFILILRLSVEYYSLMHVRLVSSRNSTRWTLLTSLLSSLFVCPNFNLQLKSAYAIAKLRKSGYSKQKFYTEAVDLYKEVCFVILSPFSRD